MVLSAAVAAKNQKTNSLFFLIIVLHEKQKIYLGKDGGNPSEVHSVEEVPGARRRGAAPAGRSGAPAPAQLRR